MKSKILKIISIITIIISMMFTKVNAVSGGTVTVNKKTAKAGETIELYIALGVESCGYDITATSSGPVSSSKVITSIDGAVSKKTNNTQRLYLVQQASKDDRTIYKSGTKIATIKYTISKDAKKGDKIEIQVTGDIVGKTSSDKNDMNTSITITVNGSSTSDKNTSTNNDKTNTSTSSSSSSSSSSSTSASTNKNNSSISSNKKDKTTATTKMPKTGIAKYSPILTIAILIVISGVLYVKYKNKHI